MSFDRMQQLMASLTKRLDNEERLATPILVAQLSKYAEKYPQDQSIFSILNVVEKLASKNNLFIKKGEFKELCGKFYTYNTRLADFLSNELGIQTAESTVKRTQSSEPLPAYQVEDTVLSNALASIFDKEPTLRTYSKSTADTVIKSIASILDSFNLKPSSLVIEDGNEKFLMVRAGYETPKGITSFYVPVETIQNKIEEPLLFIGNAGIQELNHSNIKQYVTSNAGVKLTTTASTILGLLVNASAENREISGVELALTKLNASRQEHSEYFCNQIIKNKTAETAKNVVIPRFKEADSFEQRLSTPKGIAEYKFGDKVKVARDHIVRELVSLGHRNPQITVSNNDENTIFFAVALDAGRVGFTVPVKLSEGKLLKPSVIICNGSIISFDEEGIGSLYANNQSDFKVAATASPLHDLQPNELISHIQNSLNDGNHNKAEEALNVLANSGNPKAYAIGLQTFLQGLSHKKAENESVKCSFPVKSPNSKQPICGHTGLPVHKTYVDKFGSCRPLHRLGFEDGINTKNS